MALKITPNFIVEILKVMVSLLTVIISHIGNEVANG